MSARCPKCGFDLDGPGLTAKRKRQDPKRWPPSMTPDEIEAAINAVCGCAGHHDCDCVSVFNKARGDAWARHNEARADQ